MAAPRRGSQRDGFTASGSGAPFSGVFRPFNVPPFQAKQRRPHYLRVRKRDRPRRGWFG